MFTPKDSAMDQFREWVGEDLNLYSNDEQAILWREFAETVLPGIGCEIDEWEENT